MVLIDSKAMGNLEQIVIKLQLRLEISMQPFQSQK